MSYSVDPDLETLIARTAGLFGVLFSADLLRLNSPSLNRHFFTLFRAFASPREGRGIASSTWYAGGLALAIAILPQPYAEGGVLVLALADPVANWFGRRYGKQPFGSGSRLGSMLFLVVSVAILWPIAGFGPALLAAATTALLEASPWKVDDNLFIPLAAGGILWLSTGILG